MSTFVAIDFETATARRDSACAVGLAACCGGRIVLARTYPIRPPRPRFTFTGVHGLRWEDVEHAPDFAELWPVLRAWIGRAAFLAAHNAKFDRAVLHACCARYRLRPPRTSFTCTVQLARTQWGIQPTSLPDVCRRLRIPLRHHHAGADALACARIVLAAQAAGWQRGRRRRQREPSPDPRLQLNLPLVAPCEQWGRDREAVTGQRPSARPRRAGVLRVGHDVAHRRALSESGPELQSIAAPALPIPPARPESR